MDASVAQSETVEAPPSDWALIYGSFDPATEGTRETLCALGNGYFATRGSAPWATADGVRYPGTYLAGGYNRLRTAIAGREVENEDLVNLPNWLSLQLDLGGAGWFDERTARLLAYRQELDLRFGLLLRTITFEDEQGRRSTLRERRLVSMADKHQAALELTITAENWSGAVTVRSGVDGRVVNQGAKLYALFNNRHLEPLAGETVGADGVLLVVRTTESNLHVAQATRTRLWRGGAEIETERQGIFEPGYAGQQFEMTIAEGETLRIEKTAVLYTSRDAAITEPVTAARKAIGRCGRFESVHAAHALIWTQFWGRFDIRLKLAGEPFRLNVPMLLRLNMLHLLQTASTNSIGLDIGVPARGWTGEGYEGHVFWDELFIFPTLTFRLPEISRSLLMYRYRRLGEARAAAAQAGFQGAMFPWQSGSDGQEETQDVNFNPRSGRWVRDNSFRQRHVGSAIVWNVWNYFQITGDREFLQFFGAELILEIARFWASIAAYEETRGRYEIHGVMGPDEFHEGYPGEPAAGLRNNAYTNVMAAWVMCRAVDVLERLPRARLSELRERLGITDGEVQRWQDISRKMFVPFHADGMISQFEGYEQLIELDWDAYRRRYGDIQRLDLILEAEGDSANRYKVSKQADVLMLFYLFTADQLSELFGRLGYEFNREIITPTVVYYDSRCTQGSTLSRVVAAWVLARSDRPKAMAYLADALVSDVNDIQGGTAAEGVHMGAMAGTLDLVQRVTLGCEVGDGVLRLDPQLPDTLAQLDLCNRYHGHMLNMTLTHDALVVRGREAGAGPIRLSVRGDERVFQACGTHTFRLR